MRRLAILNALAALAMPENVSAQGRGGGDWNTAGNDAQRSSWVRSDAKISPQSMQKPGFQFLWKLKLANEARQMNSITPPSLVDRHIGYRGFRSFAFIGGSSNAAFGIDSDLGRLEWERRLGPAPAAGGTPGCPGGLTAGIARPSVAAMATGGGGFGGFGRGGPAKSGVGEPHQGAVTLTQVTPPRGGGPPGGPGGRGPGAPGGRGGPGAPGGPGGFGARTPVVAYAIAGDGSLYSFYISNGQDSQPPLPFLPPNANAHGLIVVDNVAYVATSEACGGAEDGLWALDLTSKAVTSWKAPVSGSLGAAVGPDGTLYAATERGELAALEAKTLKPKDSFKSAVGFVSSPVLFAHKDRTLVAAATGDGRIHVMDAAKLGSPVSSAALANAAGFAPGSLATWEDIAGVRWLMAAGANAIHTWKLVERAGALAIETGWTSREMAAPLTPIVVNGVVFAAASGEFRGAGARLTAAQRAQRSTRAVLYALDGATGKELWSSGTTIASFARGGLSAGGSQVYLGTHDSTVYAFGMPIEH